MQTVKKLDGMTIFKKRSGRYAVQRADKKWVNGTDKVKILVDAKLIKAAVPKKEEAPAPQAEAPAEASAAEGEKAEG